MNEKITNVLNGSTGLRTLNREEVRELLRQLGLQGKDVDGLAFRKDGKESKTQRALKLYIAQNKKSKTESNTNTRNSFSFTQMYRGSVGSRGAHETESTQKEEKENPYSGTAVYLQYPNFNGSAANTVKVGDYDVGKNVAEFFGIDVDRGLPVGHSAVITIDKDGNAKYLEYGRYIRDDGKTKRLGKIRPTTRGGNWRSRNLPKRNQDESTDAYLSRILQSLPYSKTGRTKAIIVPKVDVDKVNEYASTLWNDSNRSEYGALNTCAALAAKMINAGLQTPAVWGNFSKYFNPDFMKYYLGDNLVLGLWNAFNPLSSANYGEDFLAPALGSTLVSFKGGGKLKKILF